MSKELDIDQVKIHILTKNEQNLLNQFTSENAKLNFLELWTRKEALLKAIGTGIHDSIHLIDVSDLDYFNNQTPAFNQKKWRIQSVEINDANYFSSIAYNNPGYTEIKRNLISIKMLLQNT